MTPAQRWVSPPVLAPGAADPVCDGATPVSTPRPAHEKDRLSLLRPLDAVGPVADAVGRRRPLAVHRSRRRGGGARCRRGLFPRPSLRPPARLALPASRRGGGTDEPHR